MFQQKRRDRTKKFFNNSAYENVKHSHQGVHMHLYPMVWLKHLKERIKIDGDSCRPMVLSVNWKTNRNPQSGEWWRRRKLYSGQTALWWHSTAVKWQGWEAPWGPGPLGPDSAALGRPSLPRAGRLRCAVVTHLRGFRFSQLQRGNEIFGTKGKCLSLARQLS